MLDNFFGLFLSYEYFSDYEKVIPFSWGFFFPGVNLTQLDETA